MSGTSHAAGGSPSKPGAATLFQSVEWYDRGIDWEARLRREIPLLTEVFGPPGAGGVLDAGCGPGRQAVALARQGYRVVGVDASIEMIEFARRGAAAAGLHVEWLCAPFAELPDQPGLRPARSGTVPAGEERLDAIYCIGNSLAATGSAAAAEQAVRVFGSLLRPGGAMFVQVLNFPPMRARGWTVVGPRVTMHEGREYVSVRCFQFAPDPAAGPQGRAAVTNVTMWQDGTWQQHNHGGVLYPLSPDELRAWSASAGLEVRAVYGGYDRSTLDAGNSTDLILIARRTA